MAEPPVFCAEGRNNTHSGTFNSIVSLCVCSSHSALNHVLPSLAPFPLTTPLGPRMQLRRFGDDKDLQAQYPENSKVRQPPSPFLMPIT